MAKTEKRHGNGVNGHLMFVLLYFAPFLGDKRCLWKDLLFEAILFRPPKFEKGLKLGKIYK